MTGHLLGMLEPSVVLQINRDPCCPLGLTSDRGQKTGCVGPLSNRSPSIVAVKLRARPVHGCSKRTNALEERLPALEACGDNVLVQYLLEHVMHWHFVFLATFSWSLSLRRAPF